MATILSHANIADAKSAVETYLSTAKGIYDSFGQTMGSLTNSNWIGDGAEGCKAFYNSTVSPALSEGISSIAKALVDILSNVEDTLIKPGTGLDAQLGDANRNPGGAQ